MSGIYLHIPFCKQACHYCDFHFSTSLKYKQELLEAMHQELSQRKDELHGTVETVYFGGGTPSVLSADEIAQFLTQIDRAFTLENAPEITLEANPDDLTENYLKSLKKAGVNRLSIGVQSFERADLVWMNRSHTETQALQCIKTAQDFGIDNLSIDLIYGLPDRTDEAWLRNLQQAMDLNVPHLSAYNLTVEPNTALAHQVKKGLSKPVDDAASERQFRLLHEQATAASYEHYEVSNLALPGKHSRHNSNYWKGVPYLGIGPSAHSYDGTNRSYNVAHNKRYIDGWKAGKPDYQVEKIAPETAYNEYVLTRLRTKWGCLEGEMNQLFEATTLTHFKAAIQPYIVAGMVEHDLGRYCLNVEGMLIADRIAVDLFL